MTYLICKNLSHTIYVFKKDKDQPAVRHNERPKLVSVGDWEPIIVNISHESKSVARGCYLAMDVSDWMIMLM